MTRIQFNLLAVLLLLVGAPFAIAVITNAGSSTDGIYQKSMGADNFNSSTWPGIWWDNGANFSGYYEDAFPMPYANWYFCAYVSNGVCDGPDDGNTPNQGNIMPMNFGSGSNYFDVYSFAAKQSHQHFLAPGEYLGYTGEGPFSWLIYGETFSGIENNDSLDKIKYSFLDIWTEYYCEYAGFVDLEIEASLTFIHDGYSKTLDGFNFEVSNKYNYSRVDSLGVWGEACINGLVLEFDFTGYESLAITEWNGGNWSGTDHLIKIEHIQRADGQNLGNTLLPFAGDGLFIFMPEHQSINTITAGFVIKSMTLVMSAATFALSIASTPYWDPFTNLFKGRL